MQTGYRASARHDRTGAASDRSPAAVARRSPPAGRSGVAATGLAHWPSGCLFINPPTDTTLHALLGEAVNDPFAKHGLTELAERDWRMRCGFARRGEGASSRAIHGRRAPPISGNVLSPRQNPTAARHKHPRDPTHRRPSGLAVSSYCSSVTRFRIHTAFRILRLSGADATVSTSNHGMPNAITAHTRSPAPSRADAEVARASSERLASFLRSDRALTLSVAGDHARETVELPPSVAASSVLAESVQNGALEKARDRTLVDAFHRGEC